MAEIIFFEKTGCINNTKQKKILEAAGHNVTAINMIKYAWTEDDLLLFFSKLEVKEWFNQNAPEVQKGKVKPESFNRAQALQAMTENPILIKRPLLIIGMQTLVGFYKEYLDQLIGLKSNDKSEIASLLLENLVDCPQKAKKNVTCD